MSEGPERVGGKTAREWADYHAEYMLQHMAEEKRRMEYVKGRKTFDDGMTYGIFIGVAMFTIVWAFG